MHTPLLYNYYRFLEYKELVPYYEHQARDIPCMRRSLVCLLRAGRSFPQQNRGMKVDALTKRRADGALVRIEMMVPGPLGDA